MAGETQELRLLIIVTVKRKMSLREERLRSKAEETRGGFRFAT